MATTHVPWSKLAVHLFLQPGYSALLDKDFRDHPVEESWVLVDRADIPDLIQRKLSSGVTCIDDRTYPVPEGVDEETWSDSPLNPFFMIMESMSADPEGEGWTPPAGVPVLTVKIGMGA